MTNIQVLPTERRSTRSKPPTFPSSDLFGLRALWATLRRHRLPAGAAFVLVLLATAAYYWLAVPIWKADTVVQFDPRTRPSVLTGLDPAARDDRSGQPPLAGQMEVLRSRTLLLPVIAAVGADVEVGRAMAWGLAPIGSRHGVQVQTLRLPPALQGRSLTLEVNGGHWRLLADALLAEGRVGQPLTALADGEPAEILITGAAPWPLRLSVRQALPAKAYERVQERLRVFEPSSDSDIIRLSYEDPDPRRASALLNALVSAFVEQHIVQRKEAEQQALAFLEAQLPALQQRVEQSEDALAAYREQHQSVPGAGEAETLLRQRAELMREQTLLRTRADALAARLTPQHPELAAVRQQQATVGRSLQQIDAELRRQPGQLRDLVRLERETQVGTQMYTTALAQAQQLRMAVASRLPDARQLDPALVPVEPQRPRAGAVLGVGLGMALMAALGAALLAQGARTTVSDADEVDARLGLRTLAHVPESRAEHQLARGRLPYHRIEETGLHAMLARAAPNDPAVEALRAMQLTVRLGGDHGRTQVVLVTGPRSGCGASFVAANLAALLAEAGQRVLLIEADLAEGTVHRYAGLDRNAAGLAEVVAEQRTLDDVLRDQGALGLDVILPGVLQSSEAGLLQRPRLHALLHELRQRYDQIVLHAAPTRRAGNALAAALLADAAVLVVRAGVTSVADIQDAVRLVERAAIPLKGLVLNRAHAGGATRL